MLKVKVLVKVYDGFRYNGKTEDLERYDHYYIKDETLTKNEIWKRVWQQYIGCPIMPIEIFSIEKVNEKGRYDEFIG